MVLWGENARKRGKTTILLEEKQERRSLINIADNFRKVIVVKDDIKRKIDDDGVVTIGLFDFLLDEQSIERY